MIIQPSPEFDVDAIKATVTLPDLLGSIDQSAGFRRQSSVGDEWHGPCPVCGGRDRFAVSLARGSWMCRRCHPEWSDVIGLEMWRSGADFQSAAARLQREHVAALAPGELAARRAEVLAQAEASRQREAEHRAKAREHLARAYDERVLRAQLMRHAEVIEDLEAGGLAYAAIDHFAFGFAEWHGQAALTIPWQRGGRMMSLQYRLLTADTSDKYRWHKGTSYHVWNGDAIDTPTADALYICEGAKKAGAVWSHDVSSVVAVPNNTAALGALQRERDGLAGFGRVYLILDPDSTVTAMQAARESELGNIRVVILPDKIDDWLVATGGDVDLLARYCDNGRVA